MLEYTILVIALATATSFKFSMLLNNLRKKMKENWDTFVARIAFNSLYIAFATRAA